MIKLAQWLEEGMLESWWVINPETYTDYYNKFDQSGEEMLNQLAKNNFEFYYKLYQLGGNYGPDEPM